MSQINSACFSCALAVRPCTRWCGGQQCYPEPPVLPSPERLAEIRRAMETGSLTLRGLMGKQLWAHIAAHAATIEQLQQRVVAAEAREGQLYEANSGLGELLGDVLHDLKEAWGEGEWVYVQNLIEHLESKAGGPKPAAAPPLGVASQGEGFARARQEVEASLEKHGSAQVGPNHFIVVDDGDDHDRRCNCATCCPNGDCDDD